MGDPIDRLRERLNETLGANRVEKIREHIGEILGAIDVFGLTLVGVAGLFRGVFTHDGVGAALCLAVAFLSFGLIAFLRR